MRVIFGHANCSDNLSNAMGTILEFKKKKVGMQ